MGVTINGGGQHLERMLLLHVLYTSTCTLYTPHLKHLERMLLHLDYITILLYYYHLERMLLRLDLFVQQL